MTNAYQLNAIPGTDAPADQYGIPGTAEILNLQNTDGQILIGFYAGDPSAMAGAANIPNMSIFVDSTNSKIWVKFGTVGLRNGTWKSATLS